MKTKNDKIEKKLARLEKRGQRKIERAEHKIAKRPKRTEKIKKRADRKISRIAKKAKRIEDRKNQVVPPGTKSDMPNWYYAKGGKRSKYQQGGGMYAENVLPAGLGSTAMTVYQEDNPALQQQRLDALEAQKKKSIEETEAMAKEMEASKEGDQAAIAAAAASGAAGGGVASLINSLLQ